jgi:putative restriction endonuclease
VNDVTLQTMDWNEAEPLLKSLLEEFGPDGSSNTRHYPFWHLQTDGLWQLDGPAEIVNRPPGATPTLTELRQNHVRGGFATPIYNALKADAELISILAQRIVDAHFPGSIRGDVLDAVGLAQVEGLGSARDPQRRRDPAFRAKVLMAYQYRCAVRPRLTNGATVHWLGGGAHQVVPSQWSGRSAQRHRHVLAAPQGV